MADIEAKNLKFASAGRSITLRRLNSRSTNSLQMYYRTSKVIDTGRNKLAKNDKEQENVTPVLARCRTERYQSEGPRTAAPRP
jgi:hypothetical protein